MKFNKKVLKNGLTILHEKRETDVTTVMLGVKFGSSYETEEEKGTAHFIEHLCFKGTKKRSAKQIASELEKVGGILNAMTSEESTVYHVKLPSEHLKLAMDVIFDIFFNPIFPEKEVKKEAGVICEEIRMYYDNPAAHVLNKIKECLYEPPFGIFGAGKEENIKKMSREYLLKIHKKWYLPKNSILCVVGNNNFDEIVSLAENFCPDKDMEVENKKIEIENRDLKLREIRKELQQANIAIGFHFPNMGDKERYCGELFATILGKGMSSKLFTEVREKKGLAYAVKSEIDTGKDYGYLMIYIGTDKNKIDEVIEICIKEFKKMSQISEEELRDGKKQLIGNYKVASEDSFLVANELIGEEICGKADNYYDCEKNIEKVSLEDIKKLADASQFSYFVLSS